MLPSFLRKRLFVTLLFGFSILLLLVIGITSYRNTRAWIANRDEVIAVREEIFNYEKLLSALKDAETGQRGYLLTGDSLYLQPYLDARDSLRVVVARLNTTGEKDRLTRQTEARIQRLINRRMDILAANLRRFAQLKRTNAATIGESLSFGRGKSVMDSLRVEVKQLQNYKLQLLQLRTKELAESSDRVMRAQIGGTVAGILLLVWSFVLLVQEMRKRQANLVELEEANNTLERRVQERTDELHAALEELNASNEELNASNEELFAGNEQLSVLLDQLNAARQRLNLAFQVSHMGAWEWNLRTNKIAWDENLEAVYGLGRGEFESVYGASLDGFKRLVHPDDLDGLLETVTRSMQTREPYQAEYRIIKPDGSVSWLLGQGTLLANRDNEPVGMTGIDMDITERKQNEEKVRESEERFRTMADTAPVLIWMADADGAGFYFNKPWIDFTGRTLDQEKGSGWTKGVHPEDLPRRLEIFTASLRDRKPFQMEYRLRRHDGSYCWMLDHGVPRFLPDGTFVGYIGSCMNIHERVEAEAKLKRLFDSGVLGVIEFSFESGIFAANDRFLSLIGYSREEMEQNRIDWAGLTPPEYRQLDQSAAEQLQQTGIGKPYEKEMIRKDGSRVWVLVGAALLEKKINTGIAFVIDISAQQNALQRLRQNEERFRVAIHNSPILVFNCDCDLRYTWVYNNAATGSLDDQWLVGKTDLEVMQHPEEARRMMDLKRQVIKEGTGRKEEVQVTIDGRPHSYILTLEPLRDEAGNVSGLTCATFDITERKAAEERIRRSESRLRRLFDSGMMGIVFWNQEGEITEANSTFLQQVGYTRQELQDGKLNWVNMTPPEYGERDTLSLKDLRETGVSAPFEKEYIRKDGSRVPVLVGAATLEEYTDQGVAFILDITERKEAEERVKESERLLFEVFENSADALFLINAAGNIVERYNQQAVQLFDLENNQKYVGLEAQNLQKHPFTEAQTAEVMEQLSTQGFWSAELEYVSMQGRAFWGNAAVSFITVNDRQYFLIRIRDITDRKRFEEKLQKNQQVLESIFEGVADALFLVDPASNCIVNCNQQVVRLFEFGSKEEVIGTDGNLLQKTPFTPEDLTRISREIWTKRHWSSEIKYLSRKGREFWGDIAITVVPFEDKEYLLVRVGDIDDRKQYQEILRRSQQELLRQKQRTEEALAIIAEDNERKTQELEEARTLQLSMLPQEPPALQYLDIGVIMKTSAEVGGDYYDYKLHEDGDITLVVGDATGHGLKAGIVVATVKSYFQTLAGQYEAEELLQRISEGIQNLQIRGMYMGLTVMHFSRRRLLIASSGMPPLYLYRRATGRVETILLKGLFLGSRLDVPIQQQIMDLHPGDTLLALTDGLPELFNEQREILDYGRIEQTFREWGHAPTQQIIDQLLSLGQRWNNNAPNEDDITLLAVKVK